MNRTLPKGIFKRGNGYALRFSVPIEIQSLVGKKEIVRTLGTSDLGQAIARRKEVLAEIKVSLFAEDNVRPKATQERRSGTTIRETAHRWLSESDGINNATRHRYRSILESFAEFAGNIEVSKINRSLALSFIDHLKTSPSKRTGQPLAQRTLGAYQICLASYWRVLAHWGLVDPEIPNPFSSLLRRLAGQRKFRDPRKKALRPVSRDEAEALLAYICGNPRLKYQQEMLVTVRLLWVTGCRLGEIAGLQLQDIRDHGDHIRLSIREAKTEAGNRTVMVVGREDCELLRDAMKLAEVMRPVHPENEGSLFPRLLRGGYDRTMVHYLGKALEKARKTFPTSNEWDMHSFRRSAVAALVNAGVAREARNLCVGHSNRDDIGVSVYSRRADLSEIIKSTFEVLYEELGGSLRLPSASSHKGRSIK